MEEAKIMVFCDTCDETDYGTKSELEAAGWRVQKELQLCPNCNFG